MRLEDKILYTYQTEWFLWCKFPLKLYNLISLYIVIWAAYM